MCLEWNVELSFVRGSLLLNYRSFEFVYLAMSNSPTPPLKIVVNRWLLLLHRIKPYILLLYLRVLLFVAFLLPFIAKRDVTGRYGDFSLKCQLKVKFQSNGLLLLK
jgi:hypothetical protein